MAVSHCVGAGNRTQVPGKAANALSTEPSLQPRPHVSSVEYSWFEEGPHSLAQSGLGFTMQSSLGSNVQQSSCLSLLRAGVAGVLSHYMLERVFKNVSAFRCEINSLVHVSHNPLDNDISLKGRHPVQLTLYGDRYRAEVEAGPKKQPG